MRSGEETGIRGSLVAVPSSCALPWGGGGDVVHLSPKGFPQKEDSPQPQGGVEEVILTWGWKQFPCTHFWFLSLLFDDVIVLMTWNGAPTCAAKEPALGWRPERLAHTHECGLLAPHSPPPPSFFP